MYLWVYFVLSELVCRLLVSYVTYVVFWSCGYLGFQLGKC
jgi:hypothetical protein